MDFIHCFFPFEDYMYSYISFIEIIVVRPLNYNLEAIWIVYISFHFVVVQWSPSYKAPLANGPPAHTAAFAVH